MLAMDLTGVTRFDTKSWYQTVPITELKDQFEGNGYLTFESLLTPAEVDVYRSVYDCFLSGKINASSHRHDLGSHVNRDAGVENITQIMWPSVYLPELQNTVVYKRTELLAKAILGDDMVFDFEMMIAKPPHSLAATPWHQDESYWLDMPDKRSVTFWVPLQDVYKDNGCMWFVPGSHKLPLRKHWKSKDGHHANECHCSEEEGIAVELAAGGCTGHHGRTLHYTRGNNSNEQRRAYIINYRPEAMVDYERKNKYDHGKAGLDGIIQNPKKST